MFSNQELDSMLGDLKEKNLKILQRIFTHYEEADPKMKKKIEELAEEFCPGILNFPKGELLKKLKN